jgi:hypothetical protein
LERDNINLEVLTTYKVPIEAELDLYYKRNVSIGGKNCHAIRIQVVEWSVVELLSDLLEENYF